MINDYQEQKRLESEQSGPVSHLLAEIGTVSGKTATLKFAGQASESTKYYACNKSVTFSPGDRVYVVKVSGTYIVICKI